MTVNLGLRYERLYGNANEDLDPNSFPRPLPYVDVSVRGDKNNFGPRLGAVWDLKGDGNTVVRGAWGMYYGHIRLLGTLGEFNNYKAVTVTIPNPSYPDPFNGRDPHEFISSAPPEHHGRGQPHDPAARVPDQRRPVPATDQHACGAR